MDKTVIFSYKRDNLPHSEYQVRKLLSVFREDDKESFTIHTSTASIFRVVRAFCYRYYVRLIADYEGILLPLDEHMRMNTWYLCPDFTEEDDELDILIDIRP